MPLYEYRCDSCGQEFSTRLKVSDRKDPEHSECPYCAVHGCVSMKIGAPLVSYSTNPGLKVTDNFTDRLKEIKKTKGKGCTIETKN